MLKFKEKICLFLFVVMFRLSCCFYAIMSGCLHCKHNDRTSLLFMSLRETFEGLCSVSPSPTFYGPFQLNEGFYADSELPYFLMDSSFYYLHNPASIVLFCVPQ